MLVMTTQEFVLQSTRGRGAGGSSAALQLFLVSTFLDSFVKAILRYVYDVRVFIAFLSTCKDVLFLFQLQEQIQELRSLITCMNIQAYSSGIKLSLVDTSLSPCIFRQSLLTCIRIQLKELAKKTFNGCILSNMLI